MITRSTVLLLPSVLVSGCLGEDSWEEAVAARLAWAHHQPWLFLAAVVLLLSPFFLYSYQTSVRLNQQIQEVCERRTREQKSQ